MSIVHPIKRQAYAITTGAYVGEMIVFVEENEDNYGFLSIPKNNNRHIPKDKFKFGLEQEIVEIVDSIPQDVYDLLEKQYTYNKISLNR